MGEHNKKKTHRDVAEIARDNLEQIIGEKPTGEPLEPSEAGERDSQAVVSGLLSVLRSSKARASKLSAKRRNRIAQEAARRVERKVLV